MALKIPPFSRIQEAIDTPFDNSTNGFDADNVQEAIEESRGSALSNDLDTVQLGRQGNIGDAYLLTLNNISSDSSPDVMAYNVVLRRLSVANSSNAGSYRVLIYKANADLTIRTLIYTEQFSGYTGYTLTEQNIAISAGESIYARVISDVNPRVSDVNVLVWYRQV